VLTPKEHIDMNIFEKQEAWQAKQDAARRADETKRDARNFRVNLFTLIFTGLASLTAVVAAFFAGWSATHPDPNPNAASVPKPPAASIQHDSAAPATTGAAKGTAR
jgi:hypothetical protein